jgi:tetratricopeptide (TPR) repeat protein
MGEVIGFPLSRRADARREAKKNGGTWLPYSETPSGQLTLDAVKKASESSKWGKLITLGGDPSEDENVAGAMIRFPSERVRASEGACEGSGSGSGSGGEVITLRSPNAFRMAYDLYVRASQLDEDPATYGEAEAMYRRAILLDPKLAIAHTNLGNILFRRGSDAEAEALYREAVALDDRQPEAHYNLGYVMLERGDARRAAEYFGKAVARDSRFADAHFNLAMAFEQMGSRTEAREHWKKYLDLEPNGTWADIARKHLAPAPAPTSTTAGTKRRRGRSKRLESGPESGPT